MCIFLGCLVNNSFNKIHQSVSRWRHNPEVAFQPESRFLGHYVMQLLLPFIRGMARRCRTLPYPPPLLSSKSGSLKIVKIIKMSQNLGVVYLSGACESQTQKWQLFFLGRLWTTPQHGALCATHPSGRPNMRIVMNHFYIHLLNSIMKY